MLRLVLRLFVAASFASIAPISICGFGLGLDIGVDSVPFIPQVGWVGFGLPGFNIKGWDWVLQVRSRELHCIFANVPRSIPLSIWQRAFLLVDSFPYPLAVLCEAFGNFDCEWCWVILGVFEITSA